MKEKNIKVNAVLNVIKTLSSILFPLITFPYISRVLQPDNIGKINFGSSFVSYFTLIASLGITTYAIRECAAVRNDKKKLTVTASQIFSINICTTLVAYCALAVTLLCFREFDTYRTLIIIQSLTIMFTTLGCDWLNSAMEDFIFITIRSISFQAIALVLMFVFVREPTDYLKYAFITVVSASGANIVNIFYRKKYCEIHFVKQIEWRKHLKPIMLLFVMILAQTIFNSSDVTMLGLIKGDYEVGIYSTAVKMKQLIAQVVTSLAWVIMPRMSLYFENKDYEKINRMLKRVLGVLLTLGLPSAIGCICLSDEIVIMMAGSSYIGASSALKILMVGFLISLVGGSFLGNMILLPSKRESVYMIICCLATVINLVLNYFLIPRWGVNAAAATTAFSSLIILIFLLFSMDKKIRIDGLLKSIITPILGCVFIVATCVLIRCFVTHIFIRLIISIVAGGIVFLVSQVVLRNYLVIEIISIVKDKFRRLE
ncbi:MAG: flippase [Anaerostipes sp.]|nr:flippase [Anaerostipes sp.]MDD3747420.1 flippase [Anaerostipes sp.]